MHSKINLLPSNLKSEVNDFIEFLLKKNKTKQNKLVPKFGCAKGKIYTSPDFDEPLDDFKDYI